MALGREGIGLFQKYMRALKKFEAATRERKRLRSHLQSRRTTNPNPRRPVGSPEDFRIPKENTAAQPTRDTKVSEHVVDMGEILGIQRFKGSTFAFDITDPTAGLDLHELYDKVNLNRYWKLKHEYNAAKKAYFDHIRRDNHQVHMQRAAQAAAHASNLQLLGSEYGSEEEIQIMRDEVDAACRNVLHIFRSATDAEKREEGNLRLMLETLVDAQLVGTEGSAYHSLYDEMMQLRDEGVLAEKKTAN